MALLGKKYLKMHSKRQLISSCKLSKLRCTQNKNFHDIEDGFGKNRESAIYLIDEGCDIWRMRDENQKEFGFNCLLD